MVAAKSSARFSMGCRTPRFASRSSLSHRVRCRKEVPVFGRPTCTTFTGAPPPGCAEAYRSSRAAYGIGAARASSFGRRRSRRSDEAWVDPRDDAVRRPAGLASRERHSSGHSHHHRRTTVIMVNTARQTDARTTERPTALDPPLPQYSLPRVLAVWAAAALPMGAMAWLVAPWLAR